MPEAFTLGPFLVPVRGAGFILLTLLAMWRVHRLAKRAHIDSNVCVRLAEHALWVGVIAARLGFALLNWNSFAAKPWTVLYLWQPGYLFSAGILAALLFIVYQLYPHGPGLRRAISATLTRGFALPLILFAGLLLSMNQFVDANILVPGKLIPDYGTVRVDGSEGAFSDFSGKGLVVNFWATWCPPCRREMPLLQEVYTDYASRGIVVLGISVDRSPEVIQNYLDSVGVSYPVWLDYVRNNSPMSSGALLSGLFGVVGFPTTFFVGADGIIQSVYVGELNRAILDQRIPKLMPNS